MRRFFGVVIIIFSSYLILVTLVTMTKIFSTPKGAISGAERLGAIVADITVPILMGVLIFFLVRWGIRLQRPKRKDGTTK